MLCNKESDGEEYKRNEETQFSVWERVFLRMGGVLHLCGKHKLWDCASGFGSELCQDDVHLLLCVL